MIKENQRLLNQLNILSDGVLIYLSFPAAFWVRFYLIPDGIVSVPLTDYLLLGMVFTIVQLITFAMLKLYRSYRGIKLRVELRRLLAASAIDMSLMMGWLFLQKEFHYSRTAFAVFFALSIGLLISKRIILRRILRALRENGFNQKQILLIGNGVMAEKYLNEIHNDRQLGYQAVGYIANADTFENIHYFGGYSMLDQVLNAFAPDEAVCAVAPEDYGNMSDIISGCEKAGVKLSIIPFYAEYITSAPQFDSLNDIPMLNLRRIPLDNWLNAFIKRLIDIIGSAFLLILSSPVMLVSAVGVKLTSPGPVIFKQERVGLNKKPFMIRKFRTMRVNSDENTAWSSNEDSRKTGFGAFLRKFSLDEFPQFWNVLIGDMSLVGPRPEIPYYVEQFKEEIPLYMVKHQVRPGITGWAQVNGFRGDTSIKDRVEHDIYYIEHWTLGFDIKILWITLFGGKFLNSEKLLSSKKEKTSEHSDESAVKTKKILFTASTSSHILNFHIPYLKAFHELGYEVHVAFGGDIREIPFADRIFFVPFRKSMISPANLRVSNALRRLIKIENYTLICTHTALASFFTRFSLFGIKERPSVVNMVHGYLFDDNTRYFKRTLFQLAERLMTPYTDLLITMNQWDFKFAKQYRLGKDIVNVSGAGVDFSKFNTVPEYSSAELREKYGIPSNAFVFIYPAEFSKRKSQSLLIKAMTLLPQNAVLILAGDGKLYEKCRNMARRLNLQKRVIFTGYVSDMSSLYRMADAAVTASRIEGLPFNVVEAMYMGLPVVASEVKGHTDLIAHGENGLLYPYGNYKACADEMSQLINKNSLRSKYAKAAKKTAAQYGLDNVFPHVMAKYKSLVPEKSADESLILK